MRLLRPDAVCPRCGSAPRLRIPERERERYRDDPPEQMVATYQCHRRECSYVYEIRARAYQCAA